MKSNKKKPVLDGAKWYEALLLGLMIVLPFMAIIWKL